MLEHLSLNRVTKTIKISPSPAPRHSSSMLAIIEHWEERDSCRVDCIIYYLFILLFKIGLDALVLRFSRHTTHSFYMSVFSYSLVLVDVTLFLALTMVWFLGPAQSPLSVCFLLAHASNTYAAVPLPVLVLGLLDNISELGNHMYHGSLHSSLQNGLLTLVAWAMACLWSSYSTNIETIEMEYETGKYARACQIQDSALMPYFCVCITIAMCAVLLPFCSMLPMWLKEANRLSVQRDSFATLKSDLYFSRPKTLFNGPMSDKKHILVEETSPEVPPFSISLILDFTVMWMPFIVISSFFTVLGVAVPANVTVNMLWVECANSFLIVIVRWSKSDNLGTLDLSDDFNLWKMSWSLSKPSAYQDIHPNAIFSLSDNTILHV